MQAADPGEADDVGRRAGTLLDRTNARSVLAYPEVCPVHVVVYPSGNGRRAAVISEGDPPRSGVEDDMADQDGERGMRVVATFAENEQRQPASRSPLSSGGHTPMHPHAPASARAGKPREDIRAQGTGGTLDGSSLVAPVVIEKELEAMAEAQLAATRSSVVLGSVNKFAFLLGSRWERTGDLVHESLRLADTFCGPLKMG
jgi:hypothetical protein